MKEIINSLLLRATGYRLIKNNRFQDYLQNSSSNSYEFIQLTRLLNVENELLEIFKESKSQLLQDIFVILSLNFKKNGFFVEFGATNGIKLSNTYLLEKRFNWKGILAEPVQKYNHELKKNRNCIIDTRCVFNVSGEKIHFNEVDVGELSTIYSYSNSDHHKSYRKKGNISIVESVKLLDLLIEHDAPREIDYLSIDTEGSEYDILKVFDFDKYKFRVITVEHNYTNYRNKIKKLLETKGYKRVFENLSKWDDWYIYDKN